MTTRVILNPTSGGGRAGRAAEQVRLGLERRGLGADLVTTRGPGDGVRLARQAADAAVDLVVAAGGDGTVHEVANGLLQARDPAGAGPVLGVLPIGTGNDFAKLLGPLKDLEASLDVLRDGVTRRFDAGRAAWGDRTEWFVNAGGTGLDVEVVRQIVKRRGGSTAGVVTYLAAALRALLRYDAVPLRVRMDGRSIERETMIIAVGNGRCVGGGFWVCPAAEPEDGRFDICIVRRTTFLESLWALPQVMRGKHTSHSKVEMHRAKTVEIEALGPDPLFFQLDGELHEPPQARVLALEIVPGVLPVRAART